MATTLLRPTQQIAMSNELNDSVSLLERIAAGEEAAVDECLDRYGNLVWSMARRMCPTDADDATQEIFVELWQKASTFDPIKASESHFVALVARRRLVDRLRKSRRQPTQTLDEQTVEAFSLVDADPLEIADEAAKAADCFDKLSPRHQTILSLSIQDGISHSGIAERLELPLGSVKTFARRALIQVRDCMSRPLQQVDGELA